MYTRLGIKGFEEAKPAFKRYIKAHENYKPYTYQIDEEVKRKVYNEWAFAFKELGYEI